MTDELLDAQELRELIEDGDKPSGESAPVQARPDVVPFPCTLTTVDGNVYTTSGAWQYTDLGVFLPDASNQDPKATRDVLIPFERVAEIEFHFPEGFGKDE